MRSSTSRRSLTDVRFQAGNAAVAARTARSTSSGPATGNELSSSLVVGSIRSNVPASVFVTQSPPINMPGSGSATAASACLVAMVMCAPSDAVESVESSRHADRAGDLDDRDIIYDLRS